MDIGLEIGFATALEDLALIAFQGKRRDGDGR